MTYQSITQQGASNSVEKLNALYFPKMDGNSFLDVGCNEGFFCGAAQAAGATRVVGLDANHHALKAAKEHFPSATFVHTDWEVWLTQNPDRFDFVLCASALHYAKDQAKFISLLLSKLNPFGTLILECGLSAGDGETVTRDRWDGPKTYFTQKYIRQLVETFGYRAMMLNPSVNQSGDTMPRFTLHISKLRPSIILNFGLPDTGKSILGESLSRSGIGTLSLDMLAVKLTASQTGVFKDQWRNLGEYWKLYEKMNMIDMATNNIISALPDGDPLYIEGWIPPSIASLLIAKLTNSGYIIHRINESIGHFNKRHERGISSAELADGAYFVTPMSASIDAIEKLNTDYLVVRGWFDKTISPKSFRVIIGKSEAKSDLFHLHRRDDVANYNGCGFSASIPLNDELDAAIKRSGLNDAIIGIETEERQLRRFPTPYPSL